MINLDTVGRLQEDKLYIFGQGSAEEFPQLLKGINLGAGLDLVTPEAGPFASDQVPFHEKGIPVLHLFTGPNADYHRVSDTADKVSYSGMRIVLDFADEIAVWLGDREDRLHFVPPGAMSQKPAVAAPGGQPRSVSLGTIPDFGRESGGVLVTGTMPASPAERAGFQAGDIIIGIDAAVIDNLADFSAALKGHQPGDSVTVRARRGDGEIQKRVALVARK
jgi:Zn-dependent M28 family amino/carboxypeptidase